MISRKPIVQQVYLINYCLIENYYTFLKKKILLVSDVKVY